jgi:signal transduction histidine kinase
MDTSGQLHFETVRVTALLRALQAMTRGEIDARVPVSERHDELDAIAHGINVLAGELEWAGARAREANEVKTAALQATVDSVQARDRALLKAMPDLMFIMLRDGTYVDYYARNDKLLYVPPNAFIGRKVSEVLPPSLVGPIMDAIERAFKSDDPVVVEYELPMSPPRFFEARIVRADANRLLSIVRDVTEAKRTLGVIHDLAGRLIVRQEIERQRIARELHDDVSQGLALLSIEIDQMVTQAGAGHLRARLAKLSAHAHEIASAVHNVSYELHPSRLQALGLVTAIRSLCDDASKHRNFDVTFTHGVIPSSVDPRVSLCLYRITQEALHNVARHSQAREAHVSLTCDEAHISLQIADSGIGFDAKHVPTGSLGLASMQERVAFLKGHLVVDAAAGQGTKINVRVPLGTEVADSLPLFLTV